MSFWKRVKTLTPPHVLVPPPAPKPAGEPSPEHRVFLTHQDAVDLWGLVNDPAVDLSYQEAFSVNDGVDSDGVAK